MRRPTIRMIIATLVSIAVGYATAYWGVMLVILQTEYRLFGFTYLTATAFLVALLLITILDKPLKLDAFEWGEAFWPDAERVALPKTSREKKRSE